MKANAASLPTTAASASERTVLHRKGVAAAGTEAGDRDVQEYSGDGVSLLCRSLFVRTLRRLTKTFAGVCVKHVMQA